MKDQNKAFARQRLERHYQPVPDDRKTDALHVCRADESSRGYRDQQRKERCGVRPLRIEDRTAVGEHGKIKISYVGMRKPPVASKVAGSGRFFVVYFLANIAWDISKKVEIM